MKGNYAGGALWRCLPVAVFCAAASFAQVNWTLRNPLTPTVTLRAGVWTGSQLVVAGDGGVIARSSNGFTGWETLAPGTSNTINGLTGNSSLIVAVGQGGIIRNAQASSPTVWTNRSSGTSNTLHGVALGGSWYVAVGDSGTILTSPNGSTVWTQRISATTKNLRSVDFGASQFIAVGDSGVIMTGSSNGTTDWTLRPSGSMSNLRRVRYADNIYVAVGEGGTVLTSSFGTSWSMGASNTSRHLSGLHFGNNVWVAVGDSGTVLTSSNGTSWTQRTSGTTAALYEVAWTGNRFVAVGAGGVLLTSTNGTDWTNSTHIRQTLNGIAWTGTQYVAVGMAGTLLTSPDGSAWTARTSGTAEELTAVSDNGAQIVAVGEGGVIRTSTNGSFWSGRASGTFQRFTFVRWGGSLFVAGGEGGLLATSPDGLTWTVRSSGTSAALHATAWVNGQHYVTGASGVILASPDGVTWTPRSSGTTVTLHAVRWTGSRLVAVGTGGTVLLSANGVSWERVSAGTTNALHSLVWTSSQLVAVGAGGTVVTSPNGVTWGSQASGTTGELRALDWTGSQFAAVGVNGVILTASSSTLPTAPPVPALVSPGHNATNVTDNPLGLAWQPGSGGNTSGMTYRVQLSTDSTFTALVRDDSGVTATSLNAGTPAANTTYYWRVRAKSAGYSSFWAEARRFSTENTSTPVLVSPANNATGVPLSTTLQWSAVSGGLSYRVQISTASDFSAVILDDSTLTGTSRSIAGLAVNTAYHWRVQARSASGSSAWSTARSFTTISGPPPAPVLTSPAQNATAVSVYSTLTWNAAQTATGYRVQVASDSLFAAPLRDDSSLTDPSWRGAPLPGGTALYWRVLARNQLGAGAWSVVRRFSTAPVPGAPPPAPVLAAPLNFAVNLPVSTSLLWNAVAEASHYRVQLSTQPAFSPSTSVLVDDSTLAAVQKGLSSLSGNTDYYWRVNARNPVGTSPWSEVWTFRTLMAAPTVAPVPVSPSQFATGVAIPATLSWNAVSGAVAYTAEVSGNAGFPTLSFIALNITTLTTQATGLAGNTDYYWRVRATNGAGSGPYSAVQRFTTGALPLPSTPVLIEPAAFATGVSRPTSLVWSPVSLAYAYHLQIGINAAFNLLVANDSTLTTAGRTFQDFTANTEYHWRVRAKNFTGVSEWSAPSRFTTAQGTSLRAGQILVRRNGAAANTLSFTLDHPARVTLRLRDLRGRTLMPVLDETRPAGRHTIELPPGEGALRLLEFRAGEHVNTRLLPP